MGKIILIVLLVTIQISAFAQKPDYLINLEKYWKYRYTLIHDYMKLGPNCGETIPASRHMDNWDIPNGANNGGHLHWGDATILMGQYMQVLATEYELLRLSNLNTKRTEYEIYMVLNAFDRLDLTAEERMRNFTATQNCENINPQQGDLNGFFIRDDVPPSFESQNHDHFNRDLGCSYVENETSAVVQRINGNVIEWKNNTASFKNWVDVYQNTPRYPVEMSQDQVTEIYAGLALLVRYLHSSITYNGVSLKVKAQDALLRMVDYCAAPAHIFQILNPINNHCVYGVSPSTYDATNTHCIDGGAVMNYTAPAFVNGLSHLGATWTSAQQAQIASLKAAGNQPKYKVPYLALSYINGNGSCSNASGDQLLFLYSFSTFSRSMINPWFKNVTRDHIIRASVKCDFRWPHLPLIYRLINGGDLLYPPNKGQKTYENLLDEAPNCFIYNYSGLSSNPAPNYGGTWEWSSPNRLSESYKRGDLDEQSNYSGLSFMLLYNLYAINTITTPSHYIKKMRNDYYAENVNETFPLNINGTLYGSTNSKYKYTTLEFLSTSSRMLPNANVDFCNAEQVILLPGFETDPGAIFSAYIEEYKCCNSTPNSAIQGESGFSMDDLWGNPIESYDVPEVDSTDEDYTSSDSAFAADSLIVVTQLIDSGDEVIIDLINSIMSSDSSSGNKPAYTKLLANNSKMSIYPNPNRGTFTIELSQKGDYEIQIVDVFGITVYKNQLKNEQKKEVMLSNNLPPGNYLIYISNSDFRHIERVTLIR